MISCKIFKVEKDEALLDCLSVAGTKVYRIDEIPRSEFSMASDEFIVPVAHFHKVSIHQLESLASFFINF